MARSNFLGPICAIGESETSEVNPTQGPSMFRSGVGLIDWRGYRLPSFGGDVGIPVYGWLGTDAIQVINAVPSALAANNLALAQIPVAGTPLTLTAGTGVTGSSSVRNLDTGVTATGLLAIDSAMDVTYQGPNQAIALYDPAKSLARNLRFTSVGNDSAATATVRGYDIYGKAMTETVTLANAGVAAGLKAWKYVTSVTPAGTLSGSNLSVGTGDVFGFPLRADFFGDVGIYWNNALITANTGFVAAVTTDPATAITGDTRGTYAVQSASDAAKRLQIVVRPNAAKLSLTGLFGIAQFS